MTRPMTRFALAFMTVGVVTACAAEPPAQEPAEPPPAAVDSLPGAGAVVTIPFTSVRVWFNGETDLDQSELGLEGPDGSLSLVGIHSMGEGDLMGAVSGATRPGDYTLTWTAVGAGGATATGDVRFTVSGGEPDAPLDAPPVDEGEQPTGDRD